MSTTTLPRADVETAWLTTLVADCLNLPADEIDPEVPLARLGLDSVAAVQLHVAIAAELDCEVSEALIHEYPSIDALARYMEATRLALPAVPAARDQMVADSVLPADVRPSRSQPSGTECSILLSWQ